MGSHLSGVFCPLCSWLGPCQFRVEDWQWMPPYFLSGSCCLHHPWWKPWIVCILLTYIVFHCCTDWHQVNSFILKGMIMLNVLKRRKGNEVQKAFFTQYIIPFMKFIATRYNGGHCFKANLDKFISVSSGWIGYGSMLLNTSEGRSCTIILSCSWTSCKNREGID